MGPKIDCFCDSPFPYRWETRWSPIGGEKTPHKCLVCDGRGEVQAGVYQFNQAGNTLSGPETCRSCNGLGYVWR